MARQTPAPSTVSDALAGRAEQILELLDDLLEHSTLYQWNQPGSGIASFSGNHAWRVSDEGRRARSRLVQDYRRFAAIVATLLTEQPPKALKDFDKSDKTLTRICEQSGSTWHKTADEARAAAAGALARQLELVGDLYDPSEGTPVYVPDTNALLHNPDLDKWRFSGSKRFEIVLLPTVLGELDELKVSHRDPNLRQKSEALIGRIKSYRSRGSLTDGVVLRRSVSTIRALALEPRFDRSLPWLDRENNDDRIVASFVEVMRQHPRSPVVLVTRDINLQNKAAVALIAFVEPP